MSVKFSSVIDALTETLRRFAIIQDHSSFNSELDSIIDNMQKVDVNPQDKWEILQSNFSRLKYLRETIEFYNVPTEGKFINSLTKFMESIDKQSDFYLRHIFWDSETDFYDESQDIKCFLEISLLEKDPIKKLNIVLKAYRILVSIVEDFRREPCQTILDDDFLDEFSPKIKRSRI
jgi:hypothetical protein